MVSGKEIALGIDTEASNVVAVASASERAGCRLSGVDISKGGGGSGGSGGGAWHERVGFDFDFGSVFGLGGVEIPFVVDADIASSEGLADR